MVQDKPDGTNSKALVQSERSLEVRVGEKAVEQLRADLGITHSELESLFFSPRDFAVVYGTAAALQEIDASITEKEFKPVFNERILRYVNEHAVLRARKGIFAKLFGKNGHFYLDLDELECGNQKTNLRTRIYQDVFSSQIMAVSDIKTAFFNSPLDRLVVPHAAQKIEQKLDRVIEETGSFIRNFSIVPVNESTAQHIWEAIIPVMKESSFLFGLYSSKGAVPFHASGKDFSQSRTENIMPEHTLLAPQYGAVLTDKLLMLVKDFNNDFRELVGRLSNFSKKGTKLPQNLQVSIALYNYFTAGLYRAEGNQLSGAYVTCITRALKDVKNHLNTAFASIEKFELHPVYGESVGDIMERQGFEEKHSKDYKHYFAVKPAN